MSETTSKTILFVDDEKQILRAVKRMFFRSDHRVLLASNGEEALGILAEQDVDMMITDMRMPGMDGHELLRIVKEGYPGLIRIALSGYTDKKIVLSALDKNLAKIYMFKPWNNDEFMTTIEGLFEFEALLKGRNLLDIINNLENLPTVPYLYSRISELVEQGESIEVITKEIDEDQAIASRILRIANSAYYGTKTGSIKEAISFIGLDNVKNIILTNAVYDSAHGNMEEVERLWRHSSITNKLVHLIYKKMLGKPLSKEAKSAGLLHNIGQGILLTNAHSFEPQDIVAYLSERDVGHEKIGSYILNWWEFPLPIIESAMFHHHPINDLVTHKELVYVVHVAEAYAWQVMGEENPGVSMEAVTNLGISLEKLEQMLEEIK